MFSLARFAPCFFCCSCFNANFRLSYALSNGDITTRWTSVSVSEWLLFSYTWHRAVNAPSIHSFVLLPIHPRQGRDGAGRTGQMERWKKKVTPMNPLVNVKGTINLISLSFRCKTRSAPRGPPNTQRHFGRCFALILITSKPFWSNITATSATVVSTW